MSKSRFDYKPYNINIFTASKIYIKEIHLKGIKDYFNISCD